MRTSFDRYKYVPKVWDPYNVLAPTCHDPSGRADARVVRNTPWLGHWRELYGIDTQYNPCINNYAPESVPALFSFPWLICG